MTDEAYVAIQTSKERKNIAASARKRKTHNGKSGCKLPHESMTRKELDSMNGEVTTVNVKKPMTWAEFKALPAHLQEYYATALVKEYDASSTQFGEVFGCSPVTVWKYFTARNWSFGVGADPAKKKVSRFDKKKWTEFLYGPDGEPVKTENTKPKASEDEATYLSMEASLNVSLTFEGKVNYQELAKKLEKLLGDTRGRLYIDFVSERKFPRNSYSRYVTHYPPVKNEEEFDT